MTELIVDNVQLHTKLPRAEIVELLRMRDGDACQHPDCNSNIDFDVVDGPLENTIDHWMPQWYGKENNWTHDEIWALDNLKLMHKKCNAKKGDLIPNEDGTLPPKPTRTWKNRRAKRTQRPEICTACNSGRLLSDNEFCRACGSGPQPERFPKWRQMKPSECDHADFFCVACTIYEPELRSATMAVILGTESSEF
jgi:hypothetical protein